MQILKGIAANAGTATGKVRLVKGVQDQSKFKQGEILATHLTDPSMIAMMAKASAIITEVGGTLSHPAIVSREFGLPCIVSIPNLTKIIKTGMTVTVDGKKGEVTIVRE